MIDWPMPGSRRSPRPARPWRHAFVLVVLLCVLIGALSLVVSAEANTAPTMTVVKVERNVAITVRAADFPGRLVWSIRQGRMGTQAIGGPIVAGFDSATGGPTLVRIPIAPLFAGNDRIAFRAVSGNLFSYNFAYNRDYDDGSVANAIANGTPIVDGGGFYVGDGQTEGGGFYVGGQIQGGGFYVGDQGGTVDDGNVATHTIDVISVRAGTSATFQTQNFLPGRTFSIAMKHPDVAWGVNDHVVGTLFSGPGGSLIGTVSIPPALANELTISIRARSTDGYYAFNGFLNRDY